MSKRKSQEVTKRAQVEEAVPDVLTFDLDALVRENVISLSDAPLPDIVNYYTYGKGEKYSWCTDATATCGWYECCMYP